MISGPAGLTAIKNSIAFGCEVIAFEQNDTVGGLWNYTDETGRDEFGNDVHSSMYQNLLTNIPKEIMAYPDFPFPTHETSYVSSEKVLKYVHLYTETFDLRKHIKFQHHVLRVCPRFDEKWEITVKNILEDKCEMFIADAIFVCNGFSVPLIPKIPGNEVFRGKQSHSHQFRSSEGFKNENVLVIGGGM
jgi:dimethylaniline monooxygenase (N-oxide forming)